MVLRTKFYLTREMRSWVKRKRRILPEKELIRLIEEKKNRCALSGVKMRFDKRSGTPVRGRGCHPLYASVDHLSPGDNKKGYQIVCYALNDLKGHLPLDCFEALQETAAWKNLMRAWRYQWENKQEV